jgi:pSer/pThr/pTyr-binding forkhead associated (FHA) protein
MLDLHITWPEGETRLTPADSPVQIGRSSAAQVTLSQASVSRRHLELTWTGDSWQVADSSTHGSYDLGGHRQPKKWVVDRDVNLRLGGTEGVGVLIRVVPNGTPAPAPGRNGVGTLERTAAVDAEPALAPPGEREGGGFDLGAADGPGVGLLDGRPGPDPAPGGRILSTAPGPASASARVVALPESNAESMAIPGPTGTQPAIAFDGDLATEQGSALRISVDGEEYSFLPGAEVTVGRDPSCLVQLEERHSLVSRRHLRIVHREQAWWIEDYSSKGTWVDHRRLRGPYRAQGSFVAHLGDDDAGTPMRIATAGNHRAAPSTNVTLIGVLAAAVLIPLLVLAVVLLRGDSEPDFVSAKKATVVLFGLEGGQGSGFFVSDNLIVTNQHVAALSNQLLVGVSRNVDEPAQIEYATELVANHPFLDIAVLRVSNKASITSNGPEISSEPVGDIGLPAAPLGDSSELSIGDQVFSTGFPGRFSITSTNNVGDLRLPAVVATSGELGNFGIWPGCTNPDLATFIPQDSPAGVTCSAGGDIERGVLLSTFSSGQGASGSPVFNHNEVIGVVYAGAPEKADASLNIATSTFRTWLEDLIASTP